ncbi:MAG: hypothetical protein WC527_05045 [Candidatus Margulisiibacteriota bacterium]
MNLKKLFMSALVLSALLAVQSFAAPALPGNYNICLSEVVKIGENVMVPENTLVKSAVSIGGSVGVAGEIAEDAVAIGGSVVLGPTARVHGNVVSIGGKIKKAPEAKVTGQMKEVLMPQILSSATDLSSKVAPSALILAQLFASLLTFLGILAIGMAAGFLFPKRVGWIAVSIEKAPLKAFLWGLLWVVLILPITLLLVVSIIGIPLVILQFVVYGIALALGYIAASQVLGKKLLASLRRYNQPMVTEIIWGIILLTLIGLVPVIGCLVNAVVGTMAIGASWMSRLGEG